MLKGMSVAATTLGCKVNQAETDSMLDMLKAAGANIVEFDEKADIYIVNTCSVTNIADKKSRQMLHRARKMNPDGIVIAAGCYVQSAREILEQDEAIDIVISNNKKKSITEIVNDYINVRNNEKMPRVKIMKPWNTSWIYPERLSTRRWAAMSLWDTQGHMSRSRTAAISSAHTA